MRKVIFTGGIDRGTLGITGGVYNTTDEEEKNAIRKHPEFGKRIFEESENKVQTTSSSPAPTPPSTEPTTVENTISAEEVKTVLEASDWLNANLEVPKNQTNTLGKLEAWIKSNPGKVYFQGMPGVHN